MIGIKKPFTSLILVIALLASCSKDNDPVIIDNNEGVELAKKQNETENVKIPLASLDSGIKIDGGAKIDGPAPAPNSNLTFELVGGEEAFQDAGLDIEFKGGQDIAGAYIQFKDVDGNASGSYFDVKASAFNSELNNGSKKTLNSSSGRSRSAKIISQQIEGEETTEINFDFEGLSAGRFCFDICLYDSSNNVYQIVTKCVVVEAWGGNASLVGNWVFDRYEMESDAGQDTLIPCDNGMSLEADSQKEVKDVWNLNIKEDGTYEETFDEEFQTLDFVASQADCKAVYSTTIQKSLEVYFGNWAFNEEAKTLTTIDFRFEERTSGINEDYPDGELYFEGAGVEIVNEELKINDLENGDIIVFKRN